MLDSGVLAVAGTVRVPVGAVPVDRTGVVSVQTDTAQTETLGHHGLSDVF